MLTCFFCALPGKSQHPEPKKSGFDEKSDQFRPVHGHFMNEPVGNEFEAYPPMDVMWLIGMCVTS